MPPNAGNIVHRVSNANYMIMTTTQLYSATNGAMNLGTTSTSGGMAGAANAWASLNLTNFQFQAQINRSLATQAALKQVFFVTDEVTGTSATNSASFTLKPATAGANYCTIIEVTWQAKTIAGSTTNWASSGRIFGTFASTWNGSASVYAQVGSTAIIVAGQRTGEESVSLSLSSNSVTIVLSNGVDDTVEVEWQYEVAIRVC